MVWLRVATDSRVRAPRCERAQVQALNVTRPADAKLVFKSNKERMESDAHIISHEGDPEMLLFVPFTCAVHVRAVARLFYVAHVPRDAHHLRVLFRSRALLLVDDQRARHRHLSSSL